MLEIWFVSALTIAVALAVGRGLFALLGAREVPLGISGAAGFATLVTLAPILVRLPGRGATAAVLLAVLALVCGAIAWRGRGTERAGAERGRVILALAVVAASLAVAAFPFAANQRTGVLGEGVYTNDHGAQLYWADWLQRGEGPRPGALDFGYPVGPQAFAAAVSAGTGIDLVAVFNGILLAIPALTALVALGALGGWPPVRAGTVAVLSGLPYLAASFLAQSAFKETVIALFVLALGVALGDRGLRPRALAATVVLLAAGAVATYSLPGAGWLALALAFWLGFMLLSGELRGAVARARRAVASHRLALGAAGVIVLVLAAFAYEPVREFAQRVDAVGGSRGRLASPVFPGEALGIWPEGDYRIVRGEVQGALLASAFAGLCLLVAALGSLRERRWGLLSVLLAAGLIYVVARPLTEIHVEAKALAILAPVAMLLTLSWWLRPGGAPGWQRVARFGVGALFAVLAAGSTFLALRAAPVGFDERQRALERLAERIEGEDVVFLGVDRFAAYYLREARPRSPGGFVPPGVKARPEKAWQLGEALDFDTLDNSRLDRFDWAITTTAPYASTPPPNWRLASLDGDYALWQRDAPTPRARVLKGENGDPGIVFDCGDRHAELAGRAGTALVLERPAFSGSPESGPARFDGWSERTFPAPGRATLELPRIDDEVVQLSLQYHSQVPIEVWVNGDLAAKLPASLEGIYLGHEGYGAFWPAGMIDNGEAREGAVVEVRADDPLGIQELLGVERRVWLGTLAVSAPGSSREVPLQSACGSYVDRFTLER